MSKKIIVIFGLIITFSLCLASVPAMAEETDSALETAEEQAEDIEVLALDSEEAASQTLSTVNFAGALIEVGNTELPCTLVIRDNKTQVDYTVNLTEDTVLGQRRDQYTRLSDWIPGDQIRILGKLDDNTQVVDADVAANLSIVVNGHLGVNGWIESIDTANSQITVSWGVTLYTLNIKEDTNIFIPTQGKSTIEDLELKDRIRARVLTRVGEGEHEAKIIVVLRRGQHLFQKLRNNVFKAKLISLESTEVPTSMTVKIMRSRTLKAGDVNNLIGLPGDEITVNLDENTRIVRRFMGKAELNEFSEGDVLTIAGAAQDDGTVLAKMVRDNFIWKSSSKGRPGVVTNVDTEEGKIVVDWRGGSLTILTTESTRFLIGNVSEPAISDVQVGDRIRFVGTASIINMSVTADLIIVPSSY